jgi:hypothetical protein
MRETAAGKPQAGLRRRLEGICQLAVGFDVPYRSDPIGHWLALDFPHHLMVILVTSGRDSWCPV